jgi:formate hydrogenlyase subunit 6/NADH:ubiquinone oxidoreductase subunit I
MFDEIKGFGVTFKRLFKKDLTIEYPDERRPLEERFRGLPSCAPTRRRRKQSALAAPCASGFARRSASRWSSRPPTKASAMSSFTPSTPGAVCTAACARNRVGGRNHDEQRLRVESRREGLIYQKSQLAEIGATAREYFAQ